MSEKGAANQEILDYAKLTKAKVKGALGMFLGLRSIKYHIKDKHKYMVKYKNHYIDEI